MLKEMWQYKEVLRALFIKDIKAKYKSAHLSFLWLLLKPFLIISVSYIAFSSFTLFNQAGEQWYALYVLLGLLPWLFFSQALISSSESFLNAAYLMKKVYFPRIFLPLSSVILVFCEAIVSFMIVYLFMLAKGIVGLDYLLFAFVLYSLIAILSFALGLLVAVLNVWARDLRYIVPFFLQIGIFITPIFYKTELLPLKLQKIIMYNPFVIILELLRSSLNDAIQVSNSNVMIALMLITLLFIVSIKTFNLLEEKMVDVI